MRYPKAEVEQNLAELHEILRPNDTVICVLRHVAHSGMSRRIDFYTTDLDYLSYSIAIVLGLPKPKDGLRASGFGLDLGLHIIDLLRHALWISRQPQLAGGYPLKHRWL